MTKCFQVFTDYASGLELLVCLAQVGHLILTSNLWIDERLMNGVMGSVDAICYNCDDGPTHLLVSVMFRFDGYSGPTLADGTVPICPIRRT